MEDAGTRADHYAAEALSVCPSAEPLAIALSEPDIAERYFAREPVFEKVLLD